MEKKKKKKPGINPALVIGVNRHFNIINISNIVKLALYAIYNDLPDTNYTLTQNFSNWLICVDRR